MIKESGLLSATDKYKFSEEDKIRIESQYGITKIFINDKPLQFIKHLKLVQRVGAMPSLEVDRLVTMKEIQEKLDNIERDSENTKKNIWKERKSYVDTNINIKY